MPKSAPKTLKLDESERQQLQQLVNRHRTPQQLASRAGIILLADEGHNHREIARALNISRDMVRVWRERWLVLSGKDVSIVERLQDAERSGAPATFSLEQIVQLFAIACQKPEVYERPMTNWTARELAMDWLNQIEIWFSILVRKLLTRTSFISTVDFKTRILDFIAYFNRTIAKPFQWTYKGKALAV